MAAAKGARVSAEILAIKFLFIGISLLFMFKYMYLFIYHFNPGVVAMKTLTYHPSCSIERINKFSLMGILAGSASWFSGYNYGFRWPPSLVFQVREPG